MVKAMNDIAHALGKITVAEFVEDEDTFRLLGEIGVDYGQGYHLGMPELLEGRRHEQPLTGKLAVRR
jgi:EAL domain-containing protein (putative c-di-GMP-specific phosphodiesterase class I)